MKNLSQLKNITQIEEGYLLSTNSSSLKLIFLTDDIFRVRTNFKNNWDEVSYILTQTAWDDCCDTYLGNERQKLSPLFPLVEETHDALIFQTNSLKIIVTKDPLSFEVYDLNGLLLHADIPSRAFVQDYIG
ncbi:MAG: DUF4968 domain-containing protein [Brevinema sp.]